MAPSDMGAKRIRERPDHSQLPVPGRIHADPCIFRDGEIALERTCRKNRRPWDAPRR